MNPDDGTAHSADSGAPTDPGLSVQVLRLDPGVALPAYALDGDAGADIVTAVDVVLAPGERAVLPTGLAIALPPGYAAFVHPRSGLAARVGLALVNSPGTIDSGYRGEIKVIAINHDPLATLTLRRGDRIAQLVIQRVERARFTEVSALPESVRGSGGHGSTGGSAVLAPMAAQDTAPPQGSESPHDPTDSPTKTMEGTP